MRKHINNKNTMTSKLYENKEQPDDQDCYTHEVLAYIYEEYALYQRKDYEPICNKLYMIAGSIEQNNINHEGILLNQNNPKISMRLASVPVKSMEEAGKLAQV